MYRAALCPPPGAWPSYAPALVLRFLGRCPTPHFPTVFAERIIQCVVVRHTTRGLTYCSRDSAPAIPKEPLQSFMATFQGKVVDPRQGLPFVKLRKHVVKTHVLPRCLAPPQSKMPLPYCSLLLQQPTLFMPAKKHCFQAMLTIVVKASHHSLHASSQGRPCHWCPKHWAHIVHQ